MTLTEADVQRLREALVVDAKGEEVGRVAGAHVLRGEIVGVKVRLEEAFASLPGVARDDLELAPDALDAQEDGTVRMSVGLMDAVNARMPPHGGLRDQEGG